MNPTTLKTLTLSQRNLNPLRNLLESRPIDNPTLRFTPTAWAKLQYFCHRGSTEVGGFGLTLGKDLLLVEDFLTVSQRASSVSVAFDDAAVADLFVNQVDQGRKPEQFARIWLHTHPGDSPTPSSVDEATFQRVFGSCDWAIMFILARGGLTYARLRFNAGPGGQMMIPVSVDYLHPFPASDQDVWEAEYQAHVQLEPTIWGLGPGNESKFPTQVDRPKSEFQFEDGQTTYRRTFPEEWLEDLEAMEPAERRLVMEELSVRPDLWGEEGDMLNE